MRSAGIARDSKRVGRSSVLDEPRFRRPSAGAAVAAVAQRHQSARPSVSELICRKLGEVWFLALRIGALSREGGGPEAWSGIGSLRSRYLHGRSRRRQSPFFTGDSLEARTLRSAAITRSSSSQRLQRVTSVSQSLPAFLVICSPSGPHVASGSTCTSDCVADRASRYAPIGSDQGGFGRDYGSVPPPTKDVGTGSPW